MAYFFKPGVIVNIVTVSSKGQLVIPKAVRQDARVTAGSRLEVRYVGGEIRLRPVPPLPGAALDQVAGCLARPGRKMLTDAQGMDFANALHLALSGSDDALMSFDKAFVRKAAKLNAKPQVLPA